MKLPTVMGFITLVVLVGLGYILMTAEEFESVRRAVMHAITPIPMIVRIVAASFVALMFVVYRVSTRNARS